MPVLKGYKKTQQTEKNNFFHCLRSKVQLNYESSYEQQCSHEKQVSLRLLEVYFLPLQFTQPVLSLKLLFSYDANSSVFRLPKCLQ